MSRSSTKAEYRALCSTAHKIAWISQLLRDLNISQPHATMLLCDNLYAVYLSMNPALHKRSKHFDTDWHYIREQVALGLIETKHISSDYQIADIFTKSLARRPFETLRSKLGVGQNPILSLRGDVSTVPDTAHLSQLSKAQEKPIDQRSSSSVSSSCRTEHTSTERQLEHIRNPFSLFLTLCEAGYDLLLLYLSSCALSRSF